MSAIGPHRAKTAAAAAVAQPAAGASDDEILGLAPASPSGEARQPQQLAFDFEADRANDAAAAGEPPALRGVFDANPDMRRAWHDARAYREAFPTPEDARRATADLADLARLDALFFSQRPEDHAELARAVAALDPAAFASFLRAAAGAQHVAPVAAPGAAESAAANSAAAAPTPAQLEFFHGANAAAVEGVVRAIEAQVQRLLPEGAAPSAQQRLVGEIYRELDAALRSNRELGEQMRRAFRSGALDAEHQRSIVSLLTARARQALPGVAKRVMQEWTAALLAAGDDRRARQRAAERRVDIAGSGGASSAGRASSPRDIDYARMSDADILNL